MRCHPSIVRQTFIITSEFPQIPEPIRFICQGVPINYEKPELLAMSFIIATQCRKKRTSSQTASPLTGKGSHATKNLEHINGSTPKLTCNSEMWSLLDIFPVAGWGRGGAGGSSVAAGTESKPGGNRCRTEDPTQPQLSRFRMQLAEWGEVHGDRSRDGGSS